MTELSQYPKKLTRKRTFPLKYTKNLSYLCETPSGGGVPARIKVELTDLFIPTHRTVCRVRYFQYMSFTIQYNTIQYNTIQYNTIQYN